MPERKAVDMNILEWVQQSSFTAVFLDAALKSVVVLGLAGGCCLCWRRASAATRHWLWFLAMSALLGLPLLSFIQPAWQKPMWRVSTDLEDGNRFNLTIQVGATAVSGGERPLVADATKAVETASQGQHGVFTGFNRRWLLAVPAIWFSGVVLVLMYGAVGRMRMRMIYERARALESDVWTRLLDELRLEVGLRRRVILLQSPERVMPMTWGWRRPVVLLPT